MLLLAANVVGRVRVLMLVRPCEEGSPDEPVPASEAAAAEAGSQPRLAAAGHRSWPDLWHHARLPA